MSSHRFHHLHTDTPLDPHSPYEGFWWSHMGWLLDEKVRANVLLCRDEQQQQTVLGVCCTTCFIVWLAWRGGLWLTVGSSPLQSTMERVGCRGNTSDMDVQPFYNFIQRTYPWHVVASFAALYALGGLPALVRGLTLSAGISSYCMLHSRCRLTHQRFATTLLTIH